MVAKLDEVFRRNQIMNAAIEVVREHGFEGLTHQRVADVCKCSRITVYRFVGGRKMLRHKTIEFARQHSVFDVLDRAILLRL